MPADPIGVVRRELLVRHLDAWIPYALHRSRRATFVQAYDGPDAGLADAALRAFAGFADLMRGRRVAVLVLTADTDDLAVRLGQVQAELPAEVSVHPVPGGVDRLPVALRAAGAAGAPLLAYLDVRHGPTPPAATLAPVGAGRPAEVLLALGGPARTSWAGSPGESSGESAGSLGDWLAEATGLPLATEVELVAGGAGDPAGAAELLAFATSAGRRLDGFKDALWAVDEYAGVRYRDPADQEGHLLDISLDPHPGPLRRDLLARLEKVGRCSVTELRLFTATRTVYRAADTNRALTALLTAGQVTREPADGRLTGDVIVSPADGSGADV